MMMMLMIHVGMEIANMFTQLTIRRDPFSHFDFVPLIGKSTDFLQELVAKSPELLFFNALSLDEYNFLIKTT